MANEAVTGSTPGSNLLVAAAVSKLALLKLADRESLRNHPALINLGDDVVGSVTGQHALVGLDGSTPMVAATEIESVSNTALDLAKFTITTSRYSLAHEFSDFLASKDPSGIVNSNRIAQSLVGSAMMALTGVLAALTAGFSTIVGSTGVPFTHDLFELAAASLRARGVPGPYLAVLHTEQHAQWMLDLSSRGGVSQWQAATAEQIALRGPGYQGSYMGIDIFTSSYVQSANTNVDWKGGLFGRGALGFKEEGHGPIPKSAHILLDSGPIRIEEMRSARTQSTVVVGNYRCGAVEIEDSRGVSILSAQN